MCPGVAIRVPNRGILQANAWGAETLLDAYEAALHAVHPSRVLPEVIEASGDCIRVKGVGRYCGYPVYIAGFGKAARSMAEAALEARGDRVQGGTVIAPHGFGGRLGPVEVLEGDHPVPREATLRSSMRLLEFLHSLPRQALLLVLVSGGGSALFEVPAPGLSLEDIAETTKLLMKAGADIYELNSVRKHLSSVKGGQLLRHTAARPVIGLYMSDVPGDRLDTIASGPTVPDPTSYQDAYNALRGHGVWEKTPEPVRRHILRGLRGEVPETPKPGDPVFNNTANTVVARNRDAIAAAARLLEKRGHRVLVLTDTLRGEARETAKTLASILEAMQRGILGPGASYTALVAGGETTVTVRGDGRGGRSQELCLSLALELHRLRLLKPPYAALCAGTDGVDGNSPAAGAVIDHDAVRKALSQGLDLLDALRRNDSYTLLSRLGLAIDTGGYTGVNVNDVLIALLGQQDRLSSPIRSAP